MAHELAINKSVSLGKGRPGALLAVWASLLSASAVGSSVPFQPFLECAAARGHYAYFLKASGDNASELKAVEHDVQFYLQIAESLSQSRLKKEFLAAADNEKIAAQRLLSASGRGDYLTHVANRETECRALVKKFAKEIMQAADKLYEAQP
jgi:hypothetical protein